MTEVSLPSEAVTAGQTRFAVALSVMQLALGMLIALALLRFTPQAGMAPFFVGLTKATGLCLAAQGLATLLMLVPARPRALLLDTSVVLSVTQAVVAIACLARSLFGSDLPPVLTQIDHLDAGQAPMSLLAALSFLISAGVMVLIRFRRRAWFSEIALALIALLFCLVVVSLFGRTLRLELIFGWSSYSRMPWLVSCAMLTVVATLTVIWRADGRTHERRVTAVGTAALIMVPLLAGAVGIGYVTASSEDALSRSLRVAQEARVNAVLTTLDQYGDRAVVMATRPALARQLDLLANTPGNRAVREATQVMLLSYLPHGFSSIEIQREDGPVLIAVGTPIDRSAMSLPLRLHHEENTASLLWQGGLVFRYRESIVDSTGAFVEVVTEQPINDPRGTLLSTSDLGESAALQLCGNAPESIICFPISALAPPYALTASEGESAAPIRLAFKGRSGSMTYRESDGAMSVAAYGPIGATGLVLAIRIRSAEFYGPIGRSLIWGLLLVSAVTLIGAFLLRGTIRLLAGRLAFAERRYQTVVESLQEGLLLHDAAGRVIARNRAATLIFPPAERGTLEIPDELPLHGLLREDGSDWPPSEHPVLRSLRSGKPEKDVLIGVKQEDGSPVWLNVNTVLTAGLAPGQDRGIVLSFTDVTERRRGEALVRQLDQRFRLLVEGVTDYSIVMLGVGGHVVSWNRGAERIVGYRSNEILGRHFSLFYPRREARGNKPMQDLQIAREQGRFEEEGWRVHASGKRFWANVVITAVRNEHQKLIGFSEVTRDLSERRIAEQQLAQAHQFQSAILEGAPCSIIAADPDGRLLSMNPAAERMLGYTQAELVGSATVDCLHLDDELGRRRLLLEADLLEPVSTRADIVLAKARYGAIDESEWLYVRSDGSHVPISLSVSALRDDLGVITGFLCIAYDITERRRREEMVHHIAHHDFLTGLPNRALLNDRLGVALTAARREHRQIAVLALDLDHFKRVNDTLGHHVGDQLLVTVAQRVLSCVRASDTVGRMGGDEFVVLLENVDELSGIERVAQAIVDGISKPIMIGSHELSVTPSVGVSRFPIDGDEVGVLLRHADTAMYLAKSGGRSRYRLYSRDMERAARARLDLETAIGNALAGEAFELAYQPQFSLASGEIVGMEALLRWHDPVLGDVAPAEFVPVAEDRGLMVPIGDWVLRKACRDAVQLRQSTGKALKLSVKLSSRQFRQSGIRATIAAALADSGLAPEALELDISEDALLQVEEAAEQLRGIRALGVTVAIDHFGTRFASLPFVTGFEIDTLKIDRALIGRLPGSISDAAVAHAIIALARKLGMRVVATGVETEAQLDFLHAHSVDEPVPHSRFMQHLSGFAFNTQGYLFCKPVACQEFLDRFETLCRSGGQLLAEIEG